MARYKTRPTVPCAEVWLKNPEGRFVLVQGQHSTNEDGQLIFHKQSTPEYEYAIREIGGWRVCSEDEAARARAQAEENSRKAAAMIEAGRKQRLLAKGAVPVTIQVPVAELEPDAGDVRKKGGR